MNPTDKRRLLVILAVLFAFALPFIVNGLNPNEDHPIIPLGLDLSGGVDVQIVVDTDDLARQILEARKFEVRPVLARVLQGAGSTLRLTDEEEEPGLELQLANPQEDAAAVVQALQQFVEAGWLAPINAEALATQRGTVLRLDPIHLRTEVDQKITQASRIVKERVDALGVAQSDVRVEGEDAIRVQLPGTSDPTTVRNLVRPALLEFRLIYDTTQRSMSDILRQLVDPDGGDLLPGARLEEGWEVQYHSLEGDEAIGGLPGTTTVTRRGREVEIPVEWFLVEADASIRGEHLRSVAAVPDQTNPSRLVIQFELNGEGARRFRQVTEENVGRRLAIVLENEIRSAPNIDEAIPYGRGVISGNFTTQEAVALENVLKTGALPARLIPGEMSVVGASMGEESIRSGLRAAGLGGILVLLFMLAYYSASGFLAVIAVLINVFLVLGVLSMVRATLTLPGIAGIILTVGMAVDANVLIFERIKEELQAGKDLRNSILHGFRNAFSAIVDSNITTLITALVLLQFGFGPIRGFALTMTFGILATLFTGLFVTQALMGIYFSMKQRLPLGKGWHGLEHSRIDFMKLRTATVTFSTVVILICAVRIFYGGLHLGVDFSGGVQVEVAVDREIQRQTIEDALRSGGFENPQVQTIERAGVTSEGVEVSQGAPDTRLIPGGAVETEASPEVAAAPAGSYRAESSFLVRISDNEVTGGSANLSPQQETERRVLSAVRGGVGDAHVWASQTRSVTAETGAQLRFTAIFIAVVASLFIFVYIGIRFSSVYGTAALLALFHDLIITLGIITLLGVDLSLDVVAALLTIMGYSLNDTIIVFDRMREIHQRSEGRNLKDIVNLSINQVINRTVITTGTTLLAVGSLLVLGGPGVRDFSLTLFIGFIVGTYSSIAWAAPLVYSWMQRKTLKEAKSA